MSETICAELAKTSLNKIKIKCKFCVSWTL